MNRMQKQLLNAAKKSAKHAYAPYSKFRVGAAVYTNKKIFCGANIENASSNLCICAERVAIAHARMNGATKIDGIAIYCIDAIEKKGKFCLSHQCMPCGACLQWLAELAPTAWIVNNLNEVYILSDLLPKPFRLNE